MLFVVMLMCCVADVSRCCYVRMLVSCWFVDALLFCCVGVVALADLLFYRFNVVALC